LANITLLDANQLEKPGSPGWYVTTVKLDMEARYMIERVSRRSPQVLQAVK
jgi:hypothetical protein